jgi:leader peptidase (prepilin peptidase) / N-methyltransferase
VSPAFPLGAAALAAACGWPASAAIFALGVPAGAPPRPCPRCGAPAALATRLPLRAACRTCRAAVGPSVLAVAVVAAPMAVLAGVAAVLVRPHLVACAACWLAVCAVPLAAIDAAAHRLPDALTGAAFAGVAAFLLAATAFDGRWPDLARSAAGAVVIAALFALLALLRPGSAGLGDAKLGLSVGALAGWFGWGTLALAVAAAFVLAGGYGLWLLASGRAGIRSSIAFGPFLLAGCLAAVLLAGATAAG